MPSGIFICSISRIATTVPTLALVVSNKVRGKAYGITRSLRDVSGFLMTLLTSYIYATYASYTPILYIMTFYGLLVMLFSVLCYVEYKRVEQEKEDVL
jgi:sugar phosphate permease